MKRVNVIRPTHHKFMSLAEVKEKVIINRQTKSQTLGQILSTKSALTNETVDSVKLKKIYDANLFHIGAESSEE